MRKILHIFMSLVLLLSTFGMAGTVHYCGDKLVAISLFDHNNDEACCDGIPMDCCNNDQVDIAPVNTNVTTGSVLNAGNAPFVTTVISNLFVKVLHAEFISPYTANNHFNNLESIPDRQALLSCYLI